MMVVLLESTQKLAILPGLLLPNREYDSRGQVKIGGVNLHHLTPHEMF
jgi:hypothetical protein